MGKKTKQLQEKSDLELVKLLAEQKQKLLDYRLEQASLKLKNSQKISQTKREIARILTLLQGRRIQASAAGGLKT